MGPLAVVAVVAVVEMSGKIGNDDFTLSVAYRSDFAVGHAECDGYTLVLGSAYQKNIAAIAVNQRQIVES